MGDSFLSGQRGALHRDPRGIHCERGIDSQRWPERTHQTGGEVEHDRVRNPIIERIRAIADAARNTTKGICESIQRFSGAAPAVGNPDLNQVSVISFSGSLNLVTRCN
ncbi:hypothetical protein NB496_00050 [Vibrio alginolyticus]|nr:MULTISPECIES: hypothetical protein [Vibrio]MCR9639032.1 hypothetical protein [Vibrio alginolyticus]MDW1684661.1 hypothetical protein [Vibrio sp. Vb2942]